MICPYCNNQIPDGSLECFVCGEDLLPKSTSEYYMDMDAIKEEDEKLYDKVAKQVGIETKPKLSGNQKMAMIITAFIALFLILLSLDVFKFIKYKSSSNYEKNMRSFRESITFQYYLQEIRISQPIVKWYMSLTENSDMS